MSSTATQRRIRLVVFSLAAFLQVVALFQYLLLRDVLAADQDWRLEVPLLLSASLLVSAALFLAAKTIRRAVFLIVLFVLLSILTLVNGAQVTVTASLLIACVLETVFSIPFPFSVVIVALALVGETTLPLLFLHTTWAETTGLLRLRDMLSIVSSGVVTAWIAVMARRALEKSQERQEGIERLNEAVDSLIQVATGYEQYLKLTERESATAERNRIIGEIHDSIGYTLTTILMLSEMLQRKLRVAGVAKESLGVVATVNDIAKQGLTDVRISLRILKVKTREEPNDLTTVTRLARAFSAVTNIQVRTEFSNAPLDFPSGTRDIIFRLVQECLVNSFRHGHARQILLYMFTEENRLHIIINDNGAGCVEIQDGLGLAGIKEKVASLKGSVDIQSRRNMGFNVSVVLPADTVIGGCP